MHRCEQNKNVAINGDFLITWRVYKTTWIAHSGTKAVNSYRQRYNWELVLMHEGYTCYQLVYERNLQ